MDSLRFVRLVETQLLRRGEGKDMSDPVRIITQYWDNEGNLCFEWDAHTKEFQFFRYPA